MEIRCIAIDDEPLALKKVISFIERLNGIILVKTFDNALDAIPFLKEQKIDLMFLDIQMEKFTGIQFLESVHYRPQVIITTAFEEYALKGFDLNVTDYLLKPYSFERFVQAIDKVMETMQIKLLNKKEDERSFIFVKTEYRLEKVFLDEILYIEGMRDYLQIVTQSKKIMTLQNFKFIESKLKPPLFIRVHKSFMISTDKIESIERNIIKISNKQIPVSNTYREVFFKSIEDQLPPKFNPG
jgi:two-component system, LytTR family, response regulator